MERLYQLLGRENMEHLSVVRPLLAIYPFLLLI
jgi:hypothetical protein